MKESKLQTYFPPKNLIITPSGMRGKVGESLTLDVVMKFSQSFGTWLGNNSKVLLGRDTRPSGEKIAEKVIEALNSVGIYVIDAGICPTPAILYYKRKYKIDGAVIITGSHNPPQYNGIKYLSRTNTFLGKEELEQINQYFLFNKEIIEREKKSEIIYQKIEFIQEYLTDMKKQINETVFIKKKLNVIIDSGAGAGAGVTDQILSDLGCEVISINNSFIDGKFPRSIEPIQPHLQDISNKMKEVGADIGFAHDCDADRIAIIGPDGQVYPEDTTLALILRFMLEKNTKNKYGRPIIITNIASSLMFEKISEEFGAQLIRTPIGERYLAIKMDETKKKFPDAYVFGGEGSSGGFMLPSFNNARDGVFAACKICELLATSNKSLDQLVKSLPQFFRIRKKIEFNRNEIDINEILNKIQEDFEQNKIKFVSIDKDIKIIDERKNEWVLIHPSNTEPLIRIIAEAESKNRAKELCENISSIIYKFLNIK